MKMRDPLLYRIRHAHHHRTGDAWCIYPMYDYAHPLSDALEGITHSICTLEFENNRELYDWVIAATGVAPRADLIGDRAPSPTPPRQYEFARLVLEYTMMSKRKLLKLVQDGVVAGWDDPRMPTLAGMRRRGFTPEAIRSFCDLVGVAKNNSTVDVGKLEYAVRDDLNARAPRLLGVLRPLALTLTNVTAASIVTGPLFPEDIDPTGARGRRELPLDRELVIEADDFAEAPPAGWKRLAPGRVVRLRHAGCVRCDEVIKDASGAVVELRGTLLPEPVTEKVAGVIHWVSASRGVRCEVRLYDRLFNAAKPDAADDVTTVLNPKSLEVVTTAIVEPAVVARAKAPIQLERVGYFIADEVDSRPDALVLNRVITLRDSWAKAAAAEAAPVVAKKSARSATRPDKKSAREYRDEARRRDEVLAARHAAAVDVIGADAADLLHGDRASSDFTDAAIAAAPTAAKAIARWLVNEVPRVVGDADLAGRPRSRRRAWRRWSSCRGRRDHRGGRQGAAAELASAGGDPVGAGRRPRAAPGGWPPTISRRSSRRCWPPTRPRSPSTAAASAGLLGFFVGQVMKASGGKANPASVNQLVAAALAAG
jgi:glutaminyl-tRNA synthetase